MSSHKTGDPTAKEGLKSRTETQTALANRAMDENKLSIPMLKIFIVNSNPTRRKKQMKKSSKNKLKTSKNK